MSSMPHAATPHAQSRVIRAEKVQGTAVANTAGEDLGTIRDIVLDKLDGTVRYAVLSFGGFLGLGTKLFALPWELLKYDEQADAYVIAIEKSVLENAPGFDPDHWPDMEQASFEDAVRTHYSLGARAAATLTESDRIV